MNEKDVLEIIQKDEWMIEVLKITQELDLPDWWIGAGFLRNKVWDVLHRYEKRTPLNDIDVIYFDPKNINEKQEKIYEKILNKKKKLSWSVKNQARMAVVRQDRLYVSAADGLGRWVETATCVGVKLDRQNNLILLAPHGIEDLVNLILRPTPLFAKNLKTFNQRIKEKDWFTLWPKLQKKTSLD